MNSYWSHPFQSKTIACIQELHHLTLVNLLLAAQNPAGIIILTAFTHLLNPRIHIR